MKMFSFQREAKRFNSWARQLSQDFIKMSHENMHEPRISILQNVSMTY